MDTERQRILDIVNAIKEKYKTTFELICGDSGNQPKVKPMQKGVVLEYGTSDCSEYDSSETDSDTEEDDDTVELSDSDFDALLEKMKEENHKDIKRVEPIMIRPKKQAKKMN